MTINGTHNIEVSSMDNINGMWYRIKLERKPP